MACWRKRAVSPVLICLAWISINLVSNQCQFRTDAAVNMTVCEIGPKLNRSDSDPKLERIADRTQAFSCKSSVGLYQFEQFWIDTLSEPPVSAPINGVLACIWRLYSDECNAKKTKYVKLCFRFSSLSSIFIPFKGMFFQERMEGDQVSTPSLFFNCRVSLQCEWHNKRSSLMKVKLAVSMQSLEDQSSSVKPTTWGFYCASPSSPSLIIKRKHEHHCDIGDVSLSPKKNDIETRFIEQNYPQKQE